MTQLGLAAVGRRSPRRCQVSELSGVIQGGGVSRSFRPCPEVCGSEMRWGRIEGLSQRITVVHWEKRPPPPGPGLLLNLVFNLEPVCRSGGRRAQARPGRGLWAGASQGLCLLTSRCLMGPRGRKWGVQDAARRAAAFFQGGEGSGEGCCVRPFQLSWRRRLLQGRVTLGLRSGKGLGRCRGQSTIPGILQARTLEWVAISFSKA